MLNEPSTPPRRPRIVVADDNAGIRVLIRLMIGHLADVHECADAPSAVALHSALGADAVLLDVRMPGDGLTAARRITAHDAHCAVVIVTGINDDDVRRAAVRAGARAFVLKDDLSRLPDVLRQVLPSLHNPQEDER